MTEKNVEIVRQILAEFAVTQKAVTNRLAPDVVWDMSTFTGWFDTPTYHGPEGFDEFFAQWIGPYDKWEMEVEELIDAGESRVLAIVLQRGRLRETDSWVELHYGMVYTLAGALVSRIETYANREDAFEALGLKKGEHPQP